MSPGVRAGSIGRTYARTRCRDVAASEWQRANSRPLPSIAQIGSRIRAGARAEGRSLAGGEAICRGPRSIRGPRSTPPPTRCATHSAWHA
ncbi:hypothetical protein PAI11_28780 [Patulibacter medicamentivorans]|uniref:Uncharacterized protein n=1 Tax=Patulibacter medicamentivorans TaxID=1097667 RepID=H0E7S4_9ACTN|nr:hypothetical protein PAI11_28780 [Patulibacter medicamentivorans]